jgi:hypothetical protein
LSGNPQSARTRHAAGPDRSCATSLLLSNHPAGQGLENDTLDFWFGPAQCHFAGYAAFTEHRRARDGRGNAATLAGTRFRRRDTGHLLSLLKDAGAASAVLTWPALTDDQLNLSGKELLSQDVARGGITCLPLNFIPTTDRIQKAQALPRAQCNALPWKCRPQQRHARAPLQMG